MDFFQAAERAGFFLAQERPARDAWIYSATPNRYLTYWLHVYSDGSALLTWEFAVTDYLISKAVQLGSSEALNLYMFPAADQRGPQDPAWLASAIDSVEANLQSLDFLNPE